MIPWTRCCILSNGSRWSVDVEIVFITAFIELVSLIWLITDWVENIYWSRLERYTGSYDSEIVREVITAEFGMSNGVRNGHWRLQHGNLIILVWKSRITLYLDNQSSPKINGVDKLGTTKNIQSASNWAIENDNNTWDILPSCSWLATPLKQWLHWPAGCLRTGHLADCVKAYWRCFLQLPIQRHQCQVAHKK